MAAKALLVWNENKRAKVQTPLTSTHLNSQRRSGLNVLQKDLEAVGLCPTGTATVVTVIMMVVLDVVLVITTEQVNNKNMS